jgi:8-oxo-dGTP diphosphatase
MSRMQTHSGQKKVHKIAKASALIKLSLNIDPESILENPLFKEIVDKDECAELQQEYGHLPFHLASMRINYGLFKFFYDGVRARRSRRGEVVLVLENPEKKILIHTKRKYPAGIYRLPTGGIKYHETIFNGFYREFDEETGLLANIVQLLGIIAYDFSYMHHNLPFMSYIFKATVDGSPPQAKDFSEDITDFKWIAVKELARIIRELETIKNEWRDWGVMRAVAHRVVLETRLLV